ncbi:MAG: proline racemase family protein [Alphaproteobacteria bacterium]
MSTNFLRTIQTVDSHTEGNSTRVIVGGYPIPPGKTLLEKREWLWKNDDGLRRMLNFEPRGHAMMCSVLIMPPIELGADFSVVIMEQDEYVPMCGHCILGTATTIVSTGMIKRTEPVTKVALETPAGMVHCEVEMKNGRVGGASFVNVESFLLHDGAKLEVPGLGNLTVDVAYGGDFYVFVDADALGLELTPSNEAAICAMANRIVPEVGRQLKILHPLRPDIDRCYQTLFTSAKTTTGDVKQTIVAPPGALDRSPCGTGTSARVAQLVTKGKLGNNRAHKFEGVLGTCFTGQAVSSEKRDGVLYVRPRVGGNVYLTGFHQFILDPDDPLPEGFRLGPPPRAVPRPST